MKSSPDFHPVRSGTALVRITANILGFLVCAVFCAAANPGRDIIIADFEGPDYGSWRVEGEAFGTGPARGTMPGQMKVEGYLGAGLANSFFHGDGTTGTLTSPPFELNRRYLKFLMGGGGYTNETFAELLVDGAVVRTAMGPNTRPGGSEELTWHAWDLKGLAGRLAIMRIVDRRTGGWGHINVDQITLSDTQPPQMLENVRRDFKISKRYLTIPIKNGAPKRKVTTLVNGRIEVVNEIPLADAAPDWWACMEVGKWTGRTVTLQVDMLSEDSTALKSIEQANSMKGAEDLYREPLRGQFHFSPRRGWNNDPNGLVYFKGEYHLFFQHNPYGWDWGNMHWGHAVSRDLVHWKELGDVLAPDEFGPMYSGSAVVDRQNTSGLPLDGKPPLILLYTAAGEPTVQCLASSLDGRQFTKFEANPVLAQVTPGNRDPKVIWHDASQRWVMVLYVTLPGNQHTIHFYTSPNLQTWSLASVLEGGADKDSYLYECPDIFELPVDGDQNKKKWVIYGANTEYAVGSFDGKVFRPEQSKLPGHRGRGFYAPQTFSDIPAEDGRRIQIGWLQTVTPGMSFNQSMSIPLELRLISTVDGPRLTWSPVKELTRLRAKSHRLGSLKVDRQSSNPLEKIACELVELRAEFEAIEDVVITLRGATITYNPRLQELSVNGHKAPAPLVQGRQRLVIFCDRTALEVFTSDGQTYVPMPFTPKPDDLRLAIQTTGTVNFHSLEVHELRSAWKR